MIKYYNVEHSYKLFASYDYYSLEKGITNKEIIYNFITWGNKHSTIDCGFGSPVSSANLHLFKNFNFFKNKKQEVKIIAFKKFSCDVFIFYFKDDSLQMLHKDRGPAFVECFIDKDFVIRECYFKNGMQHRINGPQETRYYSNKCINYECYRQNNVLHNEKGPAYILYYYNKNSTNKYPHIKKYYINGNNFRENDQPDIEYYDCYGVYDNNLITEMWNKNDKLHRINGPAIISYYPKRLKKSPNKKWYINGIKLDLRKFPIFENNKKINKVILRNHIIIKAFELDREYGTFLKNQKKKKKNKSKRENE